MVVSSPCCIPIGAAVISLVVLVTILTAGGLNVAAQRYATHPGVEAWSR